MKQRKIIKTLKLFVRSMLVEIIYFLFFRVLLLKIKVETWQPLTFLNKKKKARERLSYKGRKVYSRRRRIKLLCVIDKVTC